MRAALLLPALVPWASAGSAARPNFVVLFADDLGLDQIQVPLPPGFYGYSGNNGTISTPNLARLAREGLLFQTWYSSFHVCSPSRASMMTGRYSVRSGIGIPNSIYAPHAPGPDAGINLVFTAEAIGGLPLNETTTAEALRRAGYATMMFGKWHLGQREIYLPTARGFEEYLGIPFSQDMGLSFWCPKSYKPVPPFQPKPLPLLNGTRVLEQPAGLQALCARYSRAAADFIRRSVRAQRPFYLYASYNHVHTPHSCGPDWCGSSRRGPIGDAVQEMDWSVGQILDALREAGAEENTLVLFTSDNGAPQRPDGNRPLRGFKGETWEGGFREPGIARWPGRIRPGRATRAPAGTLDVHPTLLALAGLESEAPLDGVDLSPLLFAEGDDGGAGRRCHMFYAYAVASDAAKHGLSAVRCGDHKAYFFTFGSAPPAPYRPGRQEVPLVFNLATDPGEDRPVDPQSEEYKSAMLEIEEARRAHLASIEAVPDQNGRGSSEAFAICGAPNSSRLDPQWPNCTLTKENWEPAAICGSERCLAANPEFSARCRRAGGVLLV